MSTSKIIRLRRLSWGDALASAVFGFMVGIAVESALHERQLKQAKREVA